MPTCQAMNDRSWDREVNVRVPLGGSLIAAQQMGAMRSQEEKGLGRG